MSDYGYWADTMEEVSREELEEHFDGLLNESYEWMEIGILKFAPSDILRDLDPIAYRVSISDHHSALIEDGEIVETVEELQEV